MLGQVNSNIHCIALNMFFPEKLYECLQFGELCLVKRLTSSSVTVVLIVQDLSKESTIRNTY